MTLEERERHRRRKSTSTDGERIEILKINSGREISKHMDGNKNMTDYSLEIKMYGYHIEYWKPMIT